MSEITTTNMSGTMTAYVVLSKTLQEDAGGQREVWVIENSNVPARSAESAIRQHPNVVTGSTFVAVPARSWRPVTVRAEQTVVLKLEDAS